MLFQVRPMKTKWLKLMSAICSLAALLACGQDISQTQGKLEQMAQTYSHFSLTTVIQNRRLRIWLINVPRDKTDQLVAKQDQMVKELRALSTNREVLASLLKHSDPKVRTLALGAIFQREDGRDLPLIVSLADDVAETFPDLHDSMSPGGPRGMFDFENAQSVAHVAHAMVRFYLKAAYFAVPEDDVFEQRKRTLRGDTEAYSEAFSKYWRQRQNRTHCASWSLVKLRRATRQTSPLHAEYKPDVERVMAEINALRPVERAWTLLYASRGIYPHDLVPTNTVVAALKTVGAKPLMDFLQHKPCTDDPDFWFEDSREDQRNAFFRPLAVFILQNARDLLRPSDADAVLVCANQKLPKWWGGENAWYEAAAELRSLQTPAQAGSAVLAAMQQYPLYDETERRSQGLLMGGLWKARGMAEKDRLVDWFYRTLPQTAYYPEYDGPVQFLEEVLAAKRRDNKELLTALVGDPRFDRTEWATLKHMLAIANADLPLVNENEIRELDYKLLQARGPAHLVKIQNQVLVLSAWRNSLRRYCGLTERLPSTPPAPRKILSQPASSAPYADPPLQGGAKHYDRPLQMKVSPDGHWLAILQRRRFETREAGNKRFVGAIRSLPSPVAIGFFGDENTLTVFDADNGIIDWDVPATKRTGERGLKRLREERRWASFGEYAFDSTCTRLGIALRSRVACYETRTQQLLWQHENHRQTGPHMYAPEMSLGVALSPDGQRMAASIDTGRLVKLFDAGKGTVLHEFEDFAGRVQAIAFSPDGRILATATVESGVKLWDTASGKLVREMFYPVLNGAGTLVFSPDGRWLAVAAYKTSAPDSDIRVGVFRADTGDLHWELPENRTSTEHEYNGIGVAMAFSPDGRSLYTAAGKRLAVWPLD